MFNCYYSWPLIFPYMTKLLIAKLNSKQLFIETSSSSVAQFLQSPYCKSHFYSHSNKQADLDIFSDFQFLKYIEVK